MLSQRHNINLSYPYDDYMAVSGSDFNHLPLEIIVKIFTYLDTISLHSILLTNHLFNDWAKENEIWEKPILDHKIIFISAQYDNQINYKIFTQFANLECWGMNREDKFYFNLFHSQDKKLNKYYFKELALKIFSETDFLCLGAKFDQDQGVFKEVLSIQPKSFKNDLLQHAVNLDKTNTTRLLLELGANPNIHKFNHSLPLLSLASMYENLEITKLLLKYGADIEEYYDQNTPLFHAAKKRHLALVKLLCKKGANINAAQKHDFSILFASIVAGEESVVDFFLKNGADILKKDSCHNTALHFAAGQGHDKIISLLLQHEKGRELINQANNSGVTPLMLAAQTGNKKSCEILLKNNAQAERVTIMRHTAVHFALFEKHAHIIKILAEYGADCTHDAFFYNEMESPLFIAMHFLNEETKEQTPHVVNTLCEIGADLERKNQHGYTPLFWAILADNMPVVRILLRYGADVNAFSHDDFFPLRWAVTQKNEELIELLIKNGADVNIRYGRLRTTLLHLAANKESQKILRLLIENGASLLAKNSLGKTPGEAAFSKTFKQRLNFVQSLAAHYKNDKINIQIYPQYGRSVPEELNLLCEKIDNELKENPHNNTLSALSYLFHQPATQLQCMIILYVFYFTYSQPENELRIDRPAFVMNMAKDTLYFNKMRIMEEVELYIGSNKTFLSHLENYIIQPLIEGLNKPKFNKEMVKKAFLCFSFLERIILNTNKINCFDFARKIFTVLFRFPAIKGAARLKENIEQILQNYGSNQEKLASICDAVKEAYEQIRKGAKSGALFLGGSLLGDQLQKCMQKELGSEVPFYTVKFENRPFL